ncbi:hypothetical protein K2173_010368 [Erythroxylum novogranatense]|uniref:SnoaL-like domain-containing protein n=1 Tax=Erythroxylum novogranatense TaxID=1862640 RepID=A0AAV8TF92_9ROSI|nr:hypothetical protein K2173_010368 [Erythroxylum novogranatense]
MAANISCTYVSLSCRIPQKTALIKPLAGLNPRSLPLKLTSQPCQWRTKIDYRTPYSIPFKNSRRKLVMPAGSYYIGNGGSSDPTGTSLTASALVRQFYTCINETRLKELEELIADDCCLEDCSYPDPIKGKEEVLRFYEQLTAGMGRNVKFSIDHVCEDDKFTAGINWHIEWKKTQIPFTRGCSFYECSLEGNKLTIKKALVVIESPIKPGGIVLTLLKNVTAIFDEYPKAAEWFLQSFNVLQQFLSNVYTRFVAPILKPLLAGYIIMWDSVTRLLAVALKMLIFISKNFL